MSRSLLSLLITCLFAGCHSFKTDDPLSATKHFVNSCADSLHMESAKFIQNIEADNDLSVVKQSYKNLRRHFKSIESISEFYFSPTSKAINGPAIDKAEEYDDKVIEATGFQVIEEILYGNEMSKEELLQEAKVLSNSIARLKEVLLRQELTKENVFESVRLELLRIVSLGISGFDSPVSFQSIHETKQALSGIQAILSFYKSELPKDNEESYDELQNQFQKVYKFLDANTEFNSFDRSTFIRDYINPLSRVIYKYQKAAGVQNNKWTTALDMSKEDFFQQDVFNPLHFTPTYNREVSNGAIVLGKILFFEPLLSGNDNRSCASCHNPSLAFTDGRSRSLAFDFKGEIKRNSPTLINSGFQNSQFWDSRVQFVEHQVNDVISNKQEMHGSLKEAATRISSSEEYRKLFASCFTGDTVVTDRNIQAAIAAYIRSLVGLDSRFDQFMRGDESKLNSKEIKGFNLFMGKAKCGTCHFMPLFNGSVPPLYNETEAEALGVPERADTVNVSADQDLGKYYAFNRTLHKHMFKTPTVRNAGMTAPYMHNGIYKTLEEIIDFYNRGGGAGIGIELPNQTLPPEKLNLTISEKSEIVSFIHSLTDTTGLTSHPKSLPGFDDAKLNVRKIGGAY